MKKDQFNIIKSLFKSFSKVETLISKTGKYPEKKLRLQGVSCWVNIKLDPV